MGTAAILFHSTSNRENTLSYRICPSEQQVQDQQERWNDLADVLKEGLKSELSNPVSSWLQGSYKFGTQIRPARLNEEFDIDLGVYVEWHGSAQDGNIGAKQLKDKVQNILTDYANDAANDATEVTAPKTRCNRIRFTEDFHIDVPSYHLDREDDARELATEDDEWEKSDPKAIYVWWKDQFDGNERDRARRMIRYLKMWAALTFDKASRPSSILLTVLVARTLGTTATDNLSGDDEILRSVIKGTLDRLSSSSVVRNPANSTEDLNRLSEDDFEALQVELEKFLGIADRALNAVDEYESADVWSEAFRHFFPFPEERTQSESTKVENGAVSVYRCDPDIAVAATAGNRRWSGFNKIGPIPRGCELSFSIAEPEKLPEGCQVFWTVRNEGSEAESVNDVGHVAGTGIRNTESSAYKGDHFMDVVVRLNGRQVGRRRVKVHVSGLGIPLRNPRRPAWTKLRR